jgi:predicted DNA-binding transcriptional regulator YafY
MFMDPLYRQWLILRMMPRRRVIGVKEIRGRLAKEFNIDTQPRMIQRDLDYLSGVFSLESDGKKPSGWRWKVDAPLFDIPNMDPVTALTFKLAAEHVGKMLPRGVLAALLPYVRIADERLKQIATPNFSTWPEKVRVVSPNLPHITPGVPEGISETAYTALLEGRRFTAKYRRVDGEVREYEVNPLGMAFVEGLTYIVATLNDYDDPILLLLHRILEARIVDTPVRVPEGFDLDRYISRELSFPVGRDIKFKVLFEDKSDVQRLQESPIADNQRIRELRDGSFELTATVADSVQLRLWLRGYGERVEVLSPKRLRDEFAGLAKKLSEIYQQPE